MATHEHRLSRRHFYVVFNHSTQDCSSVVHSAESRQHGFPSSRCRDHIPGVFNDRKTPFGELNWTFAAVTDSIAWNALPKPLFQRFFRHDLLMPSMFRIFLLAYRVLHSMGSTPVSYPPLPLGISNHQLWQSWYLICEIVLMQLMNDGVLGSHFKENKRIHDAEGRDDLDDNKNVDAAPDPKGKTSTHPTNHTVSVSSSFLRAIDSF
jgi:hypothetical protein